MKSRTAIGGGSAYCDGEDIMWRLLVIMLVLAAVALVFVFDPAGVIAEYIILSIFTDFDHLNREMITVFDDDFHGH